MGVFSLTPLKTKKKKKLPKDINKEKDRKME
jgi:hypothetical protein